MNSQLVKIALTVPLTHADVVREAIGNAGGGELGDYAHCSFSVLGTGRFVPLQGANPAIGKIGKLELVSEERIEFVCKRSIAKKVIAAIKEVHPYEEVALDVFPLLDEEDL